MGQLENGKWVYENTLGSGPCHNVLGSAEFPFDEKTPKGRYHLYLATSCPFAHRTHIALFLAKLDSQIDVHFTYHVKTPEGWGFETHGNPTVGDGLSHHKLLSDVYLDADPNYTGRVTVPLLIDSQPTSSEGGTGKTRIVSNESLEIVNFFAKLSQNKAFGLDQKVNSEVSELVDTFYGFVGKSSNSKTQEEYDENSEKVFDALQRFDNILAKQKFLAGDHPGVPDAVVFPFFSRFDIVFAILFKLTKKRFSDYKNLDIYFRRLYQLPRIKETVAIDEIKSALFTKSYLEHHTLNPDIIPTTPELDWDVPVDE